MGLTFGFSIGKLDKISFPTISEKAMSQDQATRKEIVRPAGATPVHPAFPRIIAHPDMFNGRPCIRGMRMPVATILSYLAAGETPQVILDEFESLEAEDIEEAVRFAIWKADGEPDLSHDPFADLTASDRAVVEL